MNKEDFWKHVTSFNTGGIPDESGWRGIQNQIRHVVRGIFPNVNEFDWDAIELRAVENAMRDYDPAKSGIATWVCWWAQSAASKWIKRSIRNPVPIPFSQFAPEDEEDERDPLEEIPCLDTYSEITSQKLHFIENLSATDLSIMTGHRGIINYTVGDLLSDTIDGLSPAEIGVKANVSRMTIERALEEVGKRMEVMGIASEIRDRIAEQNRLPGQFEIQDVQGTEQASTGV